MDHIRHRLEHIFANNFSSPIFPILADLYYNNEEYNRANKVCSIGLKRDPENLSGQYILAKIKLAEKAIRPDDDYHKHLLKNIGEPHNVFLTIDMIINNDFMNGSNIILDGGVTCLLASE